MFAGIGRAGGAAPCRNFDLRPVGYVPLGALRAAAHHPSRARHLVRGPVLPACAPVLVCALLVPVPVCTFRKRAPPHYCLGRPSGRLLLYRTRHGDAIGDGPAGSPADHPGQPFRPRAPRPHPPASSPPPSRLAHPQSPARTPPSPTRPRTPLPRTRLPIPIARAPARTPPSPTHPHAHRNPHARLTPPQKSDGSTKVGRGQLHAVPRFRDYGPLPTGTAQRLMNASRDAQRSNSMVTQPIRRKHHVIHV